jgi:L-ornithine Nalpha-acyltransferase
MLKTNDFTVAVVEKGELLQKAKALRHLAFFKSEGSESDEFDNYSKHLVVIENETQDVVGTYRLLLGSAAAAGGGFYCETMFDISYFKKNSQGETLEMGRACVAPGYQKFGVLPLLWKGILAFVDKYDIGYILGSAAFDHASPEKVGSFMVYFKEKGCLTQSWKVHPLPGKQYPFVRPDKINLGGSRPPTLIRGYLRMGACVCGEPALDDHFSNVVLFMLINTRQMNVAYWNQFKK